MAYRKRKSNQQIMEEESYRILQDTLPNEWVIHNYAPDYGIDCIVETFKYVDVEKTVAETLGEVFFVQMKSVQSITTRNLRVFSRYNVEKALEKNFDEYIDIEVITFSIDTSELLTVQGMGQTVPVILFLVDIKTEKLYFLCLNDYVEKILLPESPDFSNQESKTLYIPITNIVSEENNSLAQLMFYARRAKLIGAFNKFTYQLNELKYNMNVDIVKRFISIIKEYDIWEAPSNWGILYSMGEELKRIENLVFSNIEEQINILTDRGLSIKEFIDYDADQEEINAYVIEYIMKMEIIPFWERLVNLGCIFEDLCKEWFLPTFLWKDAYNYGE